MVPPVHENASLSPCAEAYNWACYITHRLPPSVLYAITSYEGLYTAKLLISDSLPFCSKCYTHMGKEKRTSASNLEPRCMEVRPVAYRDSGEMFLIYFVLKH